MYSILCSYLSKQVSITRPGTKLVIIAPLTFNGMFYDSLPKKKITY